LVWGFSRPQGGDEFFLGDKRGAAQLGNTAEGTFLDEEKRGATALFYGNPHEQEGRMGLRDLGRKENE